MQLKIEVASLNCKPSLPAWVSLEVSLQPVNNGPLWNTGKERSGLRSAKEATRSCYLPIDLSNATSNNCLCIVTSFSSVITIIRSRRNMYVKPTQLPWQTTRWQTICFSVASPASPTSSSQKERIHVYNACVMHRTYVLFPRLSLACMRQSEA